MYPFMFLDPIQSSTDPEPQLQTVSIVDKSYLFYVRFQEN